MARAALENTSYKKKTHVDTHARFGDDDEITRTATVTAVNSCRALSLPTVLSSHILFIFSIL